MGLSCRVALAATDMLTQTWQAQIAAAEMRSQNRLSLLTHTRPGMQRTVSGVQAVKAPRPLQATGCSLIR